MEDTFSSIPGWLAAACTFAGAVATWATTRFQRWRSLDSKPLKAGLALGAFLVVALTLTAITGLLT